MAEVISELVPEGDGRGLVLGAGRWARGEMCVWQEVW